jgi:hypothetical protein
MPYIMVIDKNGNIKETNIKEYKENELFKKANFKSSEGFLLQTTWDVLIDDRNYHISLYGKTNGKAGQENKYEFPPPIDSVLFFGGCVLINESKSGSILDLRVSEWHSIYDKLMGGFEDIHDNDDDDDEEDDQDQDNIPPGMKITKEGYLCDDFIVDDEEIDYDNLSVEEDNIEEEDEIEEKKNNKSKNKVKNILKKNTKKSSIVSVYTIPETDNILDFQSELSEEEYI